MAGIGLRHFAEEQPRVHIRAFTEEVPITHAYALDGAVMNASRPAIGVFRDSRSHGSCWRGCSNNPFRHEIIEENVIPAGIPKFVSVRP